MELTELISIYRGPLVGLIASWGAPWSEANEIAQDSFVEAYLVRHSCRGDWQQPEVFGCWLRGVARNCYRNWARSRRLRMSKVATVDPFVLNEISAAKVEETPEHIFALRLAIDRLSTKHRQVVLMHYLEETRVKEMAVLLDTSEKTIEGRLYQARQKLRQLLDGKSSSLDVGRMLLWF